MIDVFLADEAVLIIIVSEEGDETQFLFAQLYQFLDGALEEGECLNWFELVVCGDDLVDEFTAQIG